MSKRFVLSAILAVALSGSLAAGLVGAAAEAPEGAAAASKRGGFAPGKIAGKWTGAWRNTTFGSRGSIRANVRARRGGALLLLVDFGGFVFGCADPPAAPVTLRRGRGNNRWNGRGFRVSGRSSAFGKLILVYNFAKKTIRGRGAAPSCNPKISYTIAGRLTPSRFNATVKIDLGAQTAISKLSAKKR